MLGAIFAKIALGTIVTISWPGTEFDKCIGALSGQLEGISAITDVKCPNGSTYRSVVGIPMKYVLELTPDGK